MRFYAANGESRVAFDFELERTAIVLVACDKSGGSQKRFYNWLIATADSRFCTSGKPESSKEGLTALGLSLSDVIASLPQDKQADAVGVRKSERPDRIFSVTG